MRFSGGPANTLDRGNGRIGVSNSLGGPGTNFLQEQKVPKRFGWRVTELPCSKICQIFEILHGFHWNRYWFCIDFPLKIFQIFRNFWNLKNFARGKNIFNFFVFKYFFDRSKIKVQATDALSFHHGKIETDAMRGKKFRESVSAGTVEYTHLQPAYTNSVRQPTSLMHSHVIRKMYK